MAGHPPGGGIGGSASSIMDHRPNTPFTPACQRVLWYDCSPQGRNKALRPIRPPEDLTPRPVRVQSGRDKAMALVKGTWIAATGEVGAVRLGIGP